MKIYFVGSISGKELYASNYKKIINVLKSLGHEVFEITMEPSKDYVYKMSDEKKVEQYKRVLNWINISDVVVVEASYPSLGVGYEISLSLEKGKPVIALNSKGDSPHFLEGVNNERLRVINYSAEEIEKILKSALEKAAENIDTRFNFFISPHISNYLDWVAKKKRTPRAVYLRRLIERAMEKEKFEQ